ncbi:MAG: hypothetical protein AB1627_13845 [Chloroflexota bacterium]
MPELDPFDIRLEHAVHAFADRAQTSVDAVAAAGRAIGRRRSGPWAVLGRAVPVPVALLVVPLVLVGLVGWSLAGGSPFPVHVWFGPAATPTAPPTPSPSPTPTPPPTPTIAPDAPAYVTGTGSSTQQSAGTTTLGEDGISHTTGAVIDVVTEMDDPRVTGTGTFRLSTDARGQLGFAWGTLRLDAGGGAWEGTCTGTTWDGPAELSDGVVGATQSCWLQGSGPHAGLTFYLRYRFAREALWVADELLGTILPAEAPSP